MTPNAETLQLEDWRLYLQSLDLSPLFVTVSGAHIYGFPSPDSDVDLRGCHRLPLEEIVGLKKPQETVDRSAIHLGLEVDWVSHDVGKYFGLLVKNNGYIMEQVFSPMVVVGNDFLSQLRPLATRCLTRNHYYHYCGFYTTQRKLLDKQDPVTSKAVLYAYRVLCTGIHLLRNGEIVTDLNSLAEDLGLDFIPELIAAKREEKGSFPFDLTWHKNQLQQLEEKMQASFETSRLPENPESEIIHEFLVDLRMNRATPVH